MKAGFKLALVVSAATLALVGCGGDSGSASSTTTGGTTTGGSTTGGSTTGGTTTGGSTALTIASYLGTYVSTCHTAGYAVMNDTGGPVYTKDTWVMNKQVDSSTISGTRQADFYSAADCSGTSLTSLKNYALTIKTEGQLVVGGMTAEKALISMTGPGGMSAGGNIIQNGVRFPGQIYFVQTNTKRLLALSGSDLYGSAEVDATAAYPTTLQTPAFAVKQ